MLRTGAFNNSKILLLDKQAKNINDRTWCFWEQHPGFFESIVYKSWKSISFLSQEYSAVMDIDPYTYKMIRGIDFYKYCFEEINKHPNVELVFADVGKWSREGNSLSIELNGQPFTIGATEIFDSIYRPVQHKSTMRLLQHFKGWVIETGAPAFDAGKATMMDFRVSQQHGTTFTYVLPFTATTALVEYTLFTKELLSPEEYDKGLKNYIEEFLGIIEYRIVEQEFGVIPMSNENLVFAGKAWQIGTAGGQTKASSGYTFQFIQKQSALITEWLLKKKSLKKFPKAPRRFAFYDHTLLYILYHGKLPGSKIFTTLFRKNKPQQVLRFLDNETSFREELKIISTLPTWPFLKASLSI